jgi:hypothetical protein
MIPCDNDTWIIAFFQKTTNDFFPAIRVQLVATCRSQRNDHILFQSDFIPAQ